jgi:hypothetical protein
LRPSYRSAIGAFCEGELKPGVVQEARMLPESELATDNLWDEIREKIFKHCALKSIDDVYAKL